MKEISIYNGTQMMSSLEIAEVTGKNHFDVLRAIRKMEPAWQKVTDSKFAVSEYKDPTGRTLPCYLLTKTECKREVVHIEQPLFFLYATGTCALQSGLYEGAELAGA
jgi:phage regulator Rha-like protein